mmetsp:Transcript_129138/g.248913  ORF Transcript_129138/g.248913 Transcript_129138/m.248913 type:complete len:212 (-) Transcript_129138:199-834(-)
MPVSAKKSCTCLSDKVRCTGKISASPSKKDCSAHTDLSCQDNTTEKQKPDDEASIANSRIVLASAALASGSYKTSEATSKTGGFPSARKDFSTRENSPQSACAMWIGAARSAKLIAMFVFVITSSNVLSRSVAMTCMPAAARTRDARPHPHPSSTAQAPGMHNSERFDHNTCASGSADDHKRQPLSLPANCDGLPSMTFSDKTWCSNSISI